MSDYSAFFNRSMNRWMCKCGSNNTGEFCDNCGLSRADGERKGEVEYEAPSETQSVFQKPAEPSNENPSVTGSMFSSGSSEQPFMKADTNEDTEDINPFKPAAFSSSSVYSDSYDESPRASRKDLVIDSPYSTRYSNDYVDPSRRRLSNRLSLISLILKYGVGGILLGMFEMINFLTLGDVATRNPGDVLASWFVIALVGSASTVGIILMIVARVKDKTAKFAKVLMIIYIVEMVVSALFGVFVVILGTSIYMNSLH